MKTLSVECTWRSITTVEVPDDYEWDGRSVDDVWAEQVDSHNAELIDWEVRS